MSNVFIVVKNYNKCMFGYSNSQTTMTFNNKI